MPMAGRPVRLRPLSIPRHETKPSHTTNRGLHPQLTPSHHQSKARLAHGRQSRFFSATLKPLAGARHRWARPPSLSRPHTPHLNSSTTISGFDPNRSGGPQVPAPLDVNTCIFPIRLNPYTNCL